MIFQKSRPTKSTLWVSTIGPRRRSTKKLQVIMRDTRVRSLAFRVHPPGGIKTVFSFLSRGIIDFVAIFTHGSVTFRIVFYVVISFFAAPGISF